MWIWSRRLAVRRALLLIAGVFVGAVLCEGGLRVVGAVRGINYGLYLRELKNSDRLPRAMWDSNARNLHGFNLKPGAEVLATTSDFSVIYTINEDGQRDARYPRQKPPGVTRILALGDSLTFGEGVPYGGRFTDIPERRLDDVEIINGAVPGWGFEDALIYYLEAGHTWSPDYLFVVLHSVDLWRNIPGLIDADGAVVIPELADASPRPSSTSTAFVDAEDPLFTGQRHWLVRRSHVLSYIAYQLERRRLHAELERQDSAEWGGEHAEKPAPRHIDVDLDNYQNIVPRASAVARRLLEECERRGTRLAIVSIEPRFSLSFFQELDERIIYIDFYPELARRQERLSFKYDPHFNPATHAFLGDLLTDRIRDRILSRR